MPNRLAPQLISGNKNVSCTMKKKTFFILFLLLLYETFFEIIFVTLQIKTPGPCKMVALHVHTNVVVLPQTLSEEKLVKTNCYLLLLFFCFT